MRCVGKKEFVYLGKRVKDRPVKGNLDHLSELREIRDAIIKDFKRGRISQRTAQGRMLLLYRIAKKDKDFEGKRRRAEAIVKKGFKELSKAIESKKKKRGKKSQRKGKKKRSRKRKKSRKRKR